MAGSIGALLVYLGWDLFAGITTPPATIAPAATIAGSPSPVEGAVASPSPSPTVGSAPIESQAGHVGYSVDLREIAGLAPTTPAGTVIDIWVTWDPPLTKVPKLQRVLRGAVVEKVVPPITTTGSPVAMLSVPERDVDDLLWADRYGSLSATTKQ